MNRGRKLVKVGDALWHVEWDLALIPVEAVPDLDAAEIAAEEPNVSIHVHGYSLRPVADVYVHGRILEKLDGALGSNCQAAHGFSGTGLFDGTGQLSAILSGTTTLRHFGGAPSDLRYRELMMNSSYEFDWGVANYTCEQAWVHRDDTLADRYTKQAYVKKCLTALRDAVEAAALNPRALLRPAFHLLSLARNRSLDDGAGVQ
jgi:hypothetical protein